VVASRSMPSDVQLKVMNVIHRVVLKASFGRIGNNLLGMPAFELTTTGRKSGRRRSVMLTSPFQEGDTIAVVASKGGNDEHPAWFLNLRDDPHVEVRHPGQDARPMTARIADAAERARLWPIITEDHDNYAGYQKKTDREIPVVLLEPRS
jgi:deazaflavin-dependent oxidoreductase (nitroreductase family)